MRIAIVTDAWKPQVNGVVTTLSQTARCLTTAGHVVKLFTPLDFWRVPCPTYPEITPEPAARCASRAHAR